MGFLSGLLSWTLAWTIYRTRPERRQNRVLALFLFLTGSAWMTSRGFALVATDPAVVFSLGVVFYAVHHAAHTAHFAFLSTLGTRVSRTLGRWWVLFLVALPIAWVLLLPSHWFAGVVPASIGTLDPALGTVGEAFRPVHVIQWAIGVVVAIMAYRGDPGRNTVAYLIAFIVHDGGLAAQLLVETWSLYVSPVPGDFGASVVLPPLLNIWLVTWLAYGVLHDQLFDIDLKLKWTISRGTVATAFLAVFFVVSVAASEFLVDRFGYLIGAAAAGLLFVALRPLQRMGERVADAALPHVKDTDEYRTVRKREVYRAAYESALQDGKVTESEKDVLATLAEELGLGPAEVRRVERGVLGA